MVSQDAKWLLEEKYRGEKSAAFFTDVKRLALGEPLAYLIGFSPFLNCKIWLDNRPLIPRPETEHWVKEAIEVIEKSQSATLGIDAAPVKVLDLCAGSGCIGVAVAKALPEVSVDFGEIDADLLPTIAKNLEENTIKPERYDVTHSNLFSNLPDKYNFILSNPPYIDPEIDRAEESVKVFEPYVALYGGLEGMEIITDIIKTAPYHLAIGGQLWLEHEPEQAGLIKTLGQKNGFSVTNHKDQYEVERYSNLTLTKDPTDY